MKRITYKKLPKYEFEAQGAVSLITFEMGYSCGKSMNGMHIFCKEGSSGVMTEEQIKNLIKFLKHNLKDYQTYAKYKKKK
jgi:hypothetical protein